MIIEELEVEEIEIGDLVINYLVNDNQNLIVNLDFFN